VAGITEMAVRELGVERVVYGSDAPGRSFASQFAMVQGANIPEEVWYAECPIGSGSEERRRRLSPVHWQVEKLCQQGRSADVTSQTTSLRQTRFPGVPASACLSAKAFGPSMNLLAFVASVAIRSDHPITILKCDGPSFGVRRTAFVGAACDRSLCTAHAKSCSRGALGNNCMLVDCMCLVLWLFFAPIREEGPARMEGPKIFT
jgi:hypothetical protein